MISIALVVLLAGYGWAVSWRLRDCRVERRTAKIVTLLSKAILFSPLLGIAVFAPLFAFVLKGELPQRASHAILVFALWMAATQFYLYGLAYCKQRGKVLCSGIGMMFSVALAVLLTPLDRYIHLIYSHINRYAFLLGCGLLGVFYAMAFVRQKEQNKANQ